MPCCCSVPSPAETDSQNSRSAQQAIKSQATTMQWLRLAVALLGAAQMMMVSLAVNISNMEDEEARWLHHLLAWGSLLLILFLWSPLWSSAWEKLKQKQVTIEQFFLIGIVGSYGASLMGSFYSGHGIYYEVPFVLFFIYYLGKVLQKKRESQARAVTQQWAEVLSKARIVEANGSMREIAVTNLKRGQIVFVASNEWIPVDGRVVRGEALVDEMALSGEPEFVRRRVGDWVMAGSKVIDAGLEIEVLYSTEEKPRGVDSILNRLQTVDMKDSGYQKIADRFVRYFLPIVLTVAALTLIYWGWHKDNWAVGLYRALTVIVVACPCALGLATPIGLWSGFHALTRRGIIPRSADFIERLNEVNAIVFDKTGTLSEERLRRMHFIKLDSSLNGAIEPIVGALQRHTNHPIARAFEDWMVLPDVSDYQCEDVRLLAGIGIEGKVRHVPSGACYPVAIGNEGIMETVTADEVKRVREQERARAADTTGGVKVYVRVKDRIVAIAFLKEVLRSTTSKAIQELKKMQFDCYVMSGDSEERVKALQIEGARWGMTAEEKVKAVQQLREEGKRVLFVGDGINDSAAMQEAYVSVAVSSAIPLTREVASAELAEARLDLIPEAIRVSRSVCTSLRHNLYFAACYNVAGMSMAALGVITPVVAALLMLGASATVSWRALRGGEKLQARRETI